jgi:glycosyltransferase involved in cell wall biosynthesis
MPSVERLSTDQASFVVNSGVEHLKRSGKHAPRKPKIKPAASIIVPVYNEAEIISRNLTFLSEFLGPNYELIVCDDCSTDGTYDVLRSVANKHQNIQILRFRKRVGKGGTIKKAVEVANSELISYIDADLSPNLKDLPRLLRLASEKDTLVVTQRTVRARLTQGVLRLIMSVGYNLIVRAVFRTGIADHQCGFKAMNKRVAKKLTGNTMNDKFVFDTELIVRARRSGIVVEEAQIDWAEKRSRKANIKWMKVATRMMKDLVVLKSSL